MTLTLRYAARSDRGLIRDGNQDSVYAGPRLLAVADGMGGMAAGYVASNVVIAAMAPLDEDVPGDALVDALRSAVETANQQLRDAVDANPALEGMGTTLTAMLFTGSKFGMVHVGDSRAYLLRDNDFVQVTKDDTYVQMLVDEGRISAEEASSHPQRSLLTRALDGRDIDPEYSVRQALPGDRYLICSDGLSGVVSAETIGETLREYVDPVYCVDRLVQLALRALLGAGLWFGWTWSQRQYYVGATPDGSIAVYQGIPGQIAGLHLSRVDHTEAVTLDQLTKVAQDRVRKGISANSASDAEQ